MKSIIPPLIFTLCGVVLGVLIVIESGLPLAEEPATLPSQIILGDAPGNENVDTDSVPETSGQYRRDTGPRALPSPGPVIVYPSRDERRPSDPLGLSIGNAM